MRSHTAGLTIHIARLPTTTRPNGAVLVARDGAQRWRVNHYATQETFRTWLKHDKRLETVATKFERSNPNYHGNSRDEGDRRSRSRDRRGTDRQRAKLMGAVELAKTSRARLERSKARARLETR